MDKDTQPKLETLEYAAPDAPEPTKVDNFNVNTFDNTPVWESAKQNPYALGWCCYILFTCIMYGYDAMASGIIIAIGKFREDYGYLYQGQWVIPADWQFAFTAAPLVGVIIGALATAFMSKRYGHRVCIGSGYLLTVAGVFLQYFSPGDLAMLLGGKILTGTPLGIFVTVAPVYCSEVAPAPLRGTMIAAVNWSQVVGQLLGYGVMRETQSIKSNMSYRIMFAVQWGFAVVGLIVLPFLPESPYMLLARSKGQAARKSISRLYPHMNIDKKVQEIEALLMHDNAESKAKATFKNCFNKKNRLRTFIALSVFVFQANSGLSWILGYMSYFLILAGMNPQSSFDVSVGIAGMMVIGNMVGWILIEKLGRRGTIFYGMVTMSVSHLLIGVLTLFVDRGNSILFAQAAFMAIWGFAYQASIGGAGYTLVAEMPTSSLRNPTQAMATFTNALFNSVWSFALPYMVNPDEANMGGKIAFFFFGLCFISSVLIFFHYPETKGRSFEEIDLLFDRGVKPRHWARTNLA